MTKPKSKPDPVPKLVTYGAPEAIKIATSNLFVEKDSLDVDYMTGLIFEDIGGMELSNIVRYDEINTTETAYSLVSNTSRVSEQINLDFNFPPQNDNSIDLNDYVNKDFLSNVNVLAVDQKYYAAGGTASYKIFYVDRDLSGYDIASNIKVTTSGIGTVNGVNFNLTNVKVIETGNGYFKTNGSGTYTSPTRQNISGGTAQFSDYVPVYYESSLYDNGIFNENYSNITIEIYNNYEQYQVEVEFVEYDDKKDAET